MSEATNDDTADSNQDSSQITQYLRRMSEGDKEAEEQVYELLMPELRRLAHHFVQRRGSTNTLQTTALVSELYLKMIGYHAQTWENRRHFLALTVRAMRSILIDDVRNKKRIKRLPPGERITLQAIGVATDPTDTLALLEAYDALQEHNPLAAEVVSLRFFCGLSMQEIADTIRESLRTAERKWRLGRIFIEDMLSRD